MDPKTLNAALISRFPREGGDGPVTASPATSEAVRAWLAGHASDTPLLDDLTHRPCILSDHDFATVAFIDLCCSTAITKARFSEAISLRLRAMAVLVADVALDQGVIALYQKHPIFSVFESVFDLSVGWSQRQTRSQNIVLAKLDQVLLGLELLNGAPNPDADYSLIRHSLVALLHQDILALGAMEARRGEKIEHRLIAAEDGKTKIARSRKLAAEMLNKAMQGNRLPEPVVQFLQQEWFDSLQLILNRGGVQSQAWLTAATLTKTLIATFQPQVSESHRDAQSGAGEDEEGTAKSKDKSNAKAAGDEKAAAKKQDLYRIIEHISPALRESLISLAHDPVAADGALAIIEAEHVEVMIGHTINAFAFEDIAISDGLLGKNTRIAHSLLAPVQALKPGRWFVYVVDGQVQHIKLTLKIDDLGSLLFTDINGLRVLQVSFEDFAYLMGSGAVVRLPSDGHFCEVVRALLEKLVSRHLMKAEAPARAAVREVPPVESVAVASQSSFGAFTFGTVVRFNQGDVKREARILVLDPGADALILVDDLGASVAQYSAAQWASECNDAQVELVGDGLEEIDDFRQVVNAIRQAKNVERQ
jgi:hypothetical protein